MAISEQVEIILALSKIRVRRPSTDSRAARSRLQILCLVPPANLWNWRVPLLHLIRAHQPATADLPTATISPAATAHILRTQTRQTSRPRPRMAHRPPPPHVRRSKNLWRARLQHLTTVKLHRYSHGWGSCTLAMVCTSLLCLIKAWYNEIILMITVHEVSLGYAWFKCMFYSSDFHIRLVAYNVCLTKTVMLRRTISYT